MTASAPGKVILFGEHFVVKGFPSIVSALCRRIYVSIVEAESSITIVSDRLKLHETLDPENAMEIGGVLAPLGGILRWFYEHYGVKPFPAVIRVRSEIPVGAGLGSSAAFAAAFSLAYASAHGLKVGIEDLERASLAAEKIAHGKPSGIDTAIAVRGGSLVYDRKRGGVPVDIGLPDGTVLIVADSGVGRSTREVVERVLSRAELAGPVSSLIYEAAGRIVEEALKAFDRGDGRLLGELMDISHGLLNAMGASSLVLERLVFAARNSGALGAKLTGAGWGGSIIALAPSEKTKSIVESLLGAGAREVFAADLGCEGARLEP